MQVQRSGSLFAAVSLAAASVLAQCSADSRTAAIDEALPPGSQVYGVFFGIDAYPKPNDLPNCRADASDMRDWVQKNGVPAGNLQVLLDRDCTRPAMLAALAELARRAKAGDEVIVYYSGHGSQVADQDGDEADGADETWVTVELDQILDDELDAAFAKIAGTVYVISDSCHSGTVSKEIEFADDDSIGKYLPPSAIDRALGKQSGFVPRDVAPERRQRQEQQNAAGGTVTPAAGIAAATRLFAACSDQEVANASRRERNSAFTAQLLAVLRETRGRPLRFGSLLEEVTGLLRNRAYRHPQNPSLFQLDAAQVVPAWLAGTPAQTAVAALADATRQRIGQVVAGLLRREDAAPNQRRDWIRAFRTDSGSNEGHTGELFGLQIDIANDAPARVWLCVFDVGPTGNMTLLYPNGYDGNRAFGAGERFELGCGRSETGLRFRPPAGQENLVAFALEWDPFTGVDFASFADTDHVFLSTDAPATGGEARSRSLLRARDVGLERRRARPGEGWDREVLVLKHR